MTKTHFEQLSDLNVDFFESAKKSLLDPLGLYLANDVKWIKLNENWNSLKFPVVMGGKGPPILLLEEEYRWTFSSHNHREFQRVPILIEFDPLHIVCQIKT